MKATIRKLIPYIIVAVLFAGAGAGAALWARKQDQKQFSAAQTDYNAKIEALQKQISGLRSSLDAFTGQSNSSALSLQEVKNRQQVEDRSQSQLATAAVAKVVPSVVSIIISQDVPQYKIAYENPFGNDPFFQNSGVQIPVYVPTGQTKSQEVGAGTGFLITSDGYILTNKHVVANANANYTVLLSNGKQETAQVIYRDPNNDLAVIKIAGSGFKPVSFGDSSSLQLGQTVIAIGNALGQYSNSVSLGVVSGLNRTIQASDSATGTAETLTGVIQTDAAINPGNSGGPLINLNGNVVGINVATVQGSNNIGFSIPINAVKGVIKETTGKTI